MSVTNPPFEPAAPADADRLRCPLCGYDLRGLTEHRCPECGHAFDPAELRAAKLRRKEWLFEHAGRRRRVWAFVITTLRGLWPIGFWREVAAADAIVPRRLANWRLAWLILFTGSCMGSLCVATTMRYRAAQASIAASKVSLATAGPSGARVIGHSGSMTFVYIGGREWAVDVTRFGPLDALTNVWNDQRLLLDIWTLVAVLSWPLLAVLALQLFGYTLRRAGIQRGHLWRCVLYAWPSVALPAVLITCAASFVGLNTSDPYAMPSFARNVPENVWTVLGVLHLAPIAAIGLVWAIAMSSVHLVAAHVRYLKLRHAAAQALLAQIVTWLTIVTLVYFTAETIG